MTKLLREQLGEQPREQIRELTPAEVNRVSGGSITFVQMSVWAGPNADIIRGGVARGIPGGGIGGLGMGLTSMSNSPLSEDS